MTLFGTIQRVCRRFHGLLGELQRPMHLWIRPRFISLIPNVNPHLKSQMQRVKTCTLALCICESNPALVDSYAESTLPVERLDILLGLPTTPPMLSAIGHSRTRKQTAFMYKALSTIYIVGHHLRVLNICDTLTDLEWGGRSVLLYNGIPSCQALEVLRITHEDYDKRFAALRLLAQQQSTPKLRGLCVPFDPTWHNTYDNLHTVCKTFKDTLEVLELDFKCKRMNYEAKQLLTGGIRPLVALEEFHLINVPLLQGKECMFPIAASNLTTMNIQIWDKNPAPPHEVTDNNVLCCLYVTIDAIASHFHKLVRLRLSIDNTTYKRLDITACSTLTCPSVRHLELERCNNFVVRDLHALGNIFPNLERLVMSKLQTFHILSDDLLALVEKLAKLKRIEMYALTCFPYTDIDKLCRLVPSVRWSNHMNQRGYDTEQGGYNYKHTTKRPDEFTYWKDDRSYI